MKNEKKTTWVFFLHKGPEPLNVSIRRIRLNRRILLNKKNRRKFNL